MKIARWLSLTAFLTTGCGLQMPDGYPQAVYNRRQLFGDAKVKKQIGTKSVKKDDGTVVEEPVYEECGKKKVTKEDGTVVEEPVYTMVDVPFVVKTEDQEKLTAFLDDKHFPPPWTWDEQTLSEPHYRIINGQKLYQQHCIHCHGVGGGGNGPTAPFLFPRPRDYRRGTFKWKSTVRNAKPTREDLLAIVRNGAVGTSMPAFGLFAKENIDDLVDYVIYLSTRGEVERRALGAIDELNALPDEAAIANLVQGVRDSWQQAASQVVMPEQSMPILAMDSAEFDASVKRGKVLYLGTVGCVKCHIADGKADPTKVATLEREKMYDDWGDTNYPRNLTLGLFRGGRRPVDIYRRIHQGIIGAQMPEHKTNLKPAEIWDLVNFVRALPYRKGLLVENAPAEVSPAPGAAATPAAH